MCEMQLRRSVLVLSCHALFDLIFWSALVYSGLVCFVLVYFVLFCPGIATATVVLTVISLILGWVACWVVGGLVGGTSPPFTFPPSTFFSFS